MNIKQGVETPDGKYVFQGSLEGPELKFVVQVGLNELAKQGALPFVSTDSVDYHDIHNTAATEQ